MLDVIIKSTKKRIKNEKKQIKKKDLFAQIQNNKNIPFVFEKVLKNEQLSFICEAKKASPSKGIIADEFDYIKIAKDYEKAGADAISVLTEPEYFLGSDKYLIEIKQNVCIPVLRKDFTVDTFQILTACAMGADAILLIASILNTRKLKKFIKFADKYGVSCLVETHNEKEIKSAIKAGARIIGVNNRNLKTFEVNINNSIKLRKLVDKNIIFVSESGIKTKEDINNLKQNNVNAVLMGETLMRAKDKIRAIKELKGEVDDKD